MSKPPLWTFAGYITEAGGRILQEWYDTLPENQYEDFQDQLNYLADTEVWKRPEFDKVAPPLHEIRINETRVYGVFHPGRRRCFLFLHGVTAKKKKHDKKGQDVALAHLALLKQGKARTHEFVIEGRPTQSNQTKQGSEIEASGFQPGKRNSQPNPRNKG
jgi:hypothetical protein